MFGNKWEGAGHAIRIKLVSVIERKKYISFAYTVFICIKSQLMAFGGNWTLMRGIQRGVSHYRRYNVNEKTQKEKMLSICHAMLRKR